MPMAGLRPDHESTTGIPRWMRILGIIALIVVLLVVIVILTGGGLDGPGGHTPPEGAH